ncbi:putative protein YLS9 [Iris pallida]|uniref:Late embryogenesis abundant protein LEA-2 subgroup domain-containing protein n=1 Tax=Iris pallida TaxID=29817 RepID=A0AAX6E9W8_IRIPA|nr:putative protein YLS9 [Iris pallida]
MSSKDCEHHGADCERQRLYRRAFAAVLALLLLVLLTVLVVWLVLRPAKPAFYLRDVALSQLAVVPALTGGGGGGSSLTVAAQVTLSSRNPNERIGVYYDRMDVYAVYKGQQVTVPTALPRGYQGHGDVALWSPNLWGTAVPLPGPLAQSLAQDTGAGVLLLQFRVGGRLRWKVGTWTSGTYHLFVNCPALLMKNYNNGSSGSGSGGYRLQQGTVTCSVDV